MDIALFLSANATVKSAVIAADIVVSVAAVGVVVVVAVVVAVLRVLPALCLPQLLSFLSSYPPCPALSGGLANKFQ